jgi:cold-inducible RNA-binding protein
VSFMKVYVGNISRHISDEQFHALALPFANAESVSVPREVDSGRTKGYGFLEFTSRDEALAVIAGLNGKDIDGQILNASEANAARGMRRI